MTPEEHALLVASVESAGRAAWESQGMGQKTSEGEGLAIDLIASHLLPTPKDDPQRDQKDAMNADTAFSAILGATAAALAASTGGWTAAGVAAAAASVRVAWMKLSTQDRARVWRGEVDS